MKLKSSIYIVAAVAGVCLCTACDNNHEPVTEGEKTLVFRPAVAQMDQQLFTRATNSFFNDGDQISVEVIPDKPASAAGNVYTYTFNPSRIFTGNYRFKQDNSYIVSLRALWPSQSERNSGIITDQRKIEDYQKADRLKAEAHSYNILSTAEPVPLSFTHEQSRLTFRIEGQNANGLYIKELLIELEADLGEGMTQAAFWAYCKENGNAELILPAGVKIKPEESGRYTIGLATVGSKDTSVNDYQGVVYIPGDTDLTLTESTDYVVSLTPQGYDLFAYIGISSFTQSEGHTGIPVQMPKLLSEGVYTIENSLQLVTLSLLLKGGYIQGEDAEIWKNYQYSLAAGLYITEYGKRYYKPIAAGLKSTLFVNGELTVKDTAGADFELFEK